MANKVKPPKVGTMAFGQRAKGRYDEMRGKPGGPHKTIGLSRGAISARDALNIKERQRQEKDPEVNLQRGQIFKKGKKNG